MKRNHPDWLHNGLLSGTGSDLAAASLWKFLPFLPTAATRNSKLSTLWIEFRDWDGHKFTPNVPEFTLRLIGKGDSLSAMPELSTKVKGYGCKTLCVWLAFKAQELCAANSNEELKMLTTCLWAFAEMQRVWDSAGDHLTDSEAFQQHYAGHLFLSLYTRLADRAYKSAESCYKIRPKLHFIEHTLDHVLASHENPMTFHTFMDEDFMGKIKRISRACHRSTLAQRTLQRYTVKIGVRTQKALKKKRQLLRKLVSKYQAT
jgi:hypothetical protein